MSETVKRALWTLLVCVLVGAAGFSAGRFSAPLQVEERVDVRLVDHVVVKTVTVTEKAKSQIVYRDRVITKEGEIREHETIRTVEVERADDRRELVADRAVEEHHEKTVTLRPDWRVSVQAGASLVTPFVPIAGPLVIQACGSRRIVGGLSADVCLSTVGAATAGFALEF